MIIDDRYMRSLQRSTYSIEARTWTLDPQYWYSKKSPLEGKISSSESWTLSLGLWFQFEG